MSRTNVSCSTSLARSASPNDRVDAGEIGAGHTITALYEIVPAGVDESPAGDELRYGPARPRSIADSASSPSIADELLTLKVRYKQPNGAVSTKREFPLTDRGTTFAQASEDFRFAGAVAAFGMILRDSPHRGAATLADVVHWAEAASGTDTGGYRAEFIELVKKAQALPPR